MANDRLYRFASRKATAWSKTQMPGYWTVLQVLVGAGFAVFLAVQLIGGGGSPAEGTAPVVSLPRGEQPSTAPDPAAPAPSATTAPGQDALVELPGAGGQLVSVPQGAADLARTALAALFDPALAAQVPATGGGTLPPPAQAYPAASVGDLTVVLAADDRYSFAAPTDADGPGDVFTAVTSSVTVVRAGDGWAVEVV